MATIEGLLVWSSQALTPLVREDNTTSPSIVAKSSKVNLLVNIKVVMATIEGLLVLSSLIRGVNASEDSPSSPSIGVITNILFSTIYIHYNFTGKWKGCYCDYRRAPGIVLP